jgi:hypothetical protein
MRKAISIIAVLMFMISSFGFAEETAFNGCKLADAKGKQADAKLIFSDNNKNLVIQVSDRELLTIPYENLDKFSYDYTKKHRVTEGAIVMIASIGAGAVVMLTQSKSHWLYIDYREQNMPKTLVLRMDKNEYKKIFNAIQAHTGKQVEFLGNEKGAKTQAKEREAEVKNTGQTE